MSTELTKNEQNALSVNYMSRGVEVSIDIDFAKKYLVRGRSDLVSDQELMFFLNTCKMSGLNPLVGSEVYCIKYSQNDPAQVVVGKNAYLRRAFEHPDYLGKEDGIVVQRGNDIVQKEGCCLYPGEVLIGGWCKVHFMRNDKERTAFKEVSLNEYDKGQANWKNKPATMINKVAISQCVREAFPTDYEGLYSEDEMLASGAIPSTYETTTTTQTTSNGFPERIDPSNVRDAEYIEDPIITQEQRQAMFQMGKEHLGKNGKEVIRALIAELGYESTDTMLTSDYNTVLEKLMTIIEDSKRQASDE